MRRALEETVVEGIDTTIPLHLRILKDEAFLKGEIHTGYLDQLLNAEPAPQ
jgi:acetyl-CoA carboxylase biotin carboxylase subunit